MRSLPGTTEEWDDVDVVIPVRNEADMIEVALQSVWTQQYPGRVHIFIGLAPSTDGTDEVLRRVAAERSDLVIVPNSSGRTAAGLNAAIAAGASPVVVRLDGHARMSPGYLRRAVEVMRATGAVNVGGRQIPQSGTPFQDAIGVAMTSRFGTGGAAFHVGGASADVDTVYLGVFDRRALEAVGGFDETLVRNQDYELNIRLRRNGGRIRFDPELWVAYSPRARWRSLTRQYFEYGMWKSVVARRHPGSLRPRQLAPVAMVVALAVASVTGLARRRSLLVPAVYGTLVVAASARSPHRWRLICIYPTMHLAWGVGFLFGLVRLRTASHGSRASPASVSR